MNSWRTSTVVAMCEGMRQTQDYSALPILADALEDAGCTDQKVLEYLRNPGSEIDSQRIVALIYSEATEEAVRLVEKYAGEIGTPRRYVEYGEPVPPEDSFTYSRLMMEAKYYLQNADHYVHMGDNERYKNLDFDAFWGAYELIVGRPVNWADRDRWDVRGSFFSCSC